MHPHWWKTKAAKARACLALFAVFAFLPALAVTPPDGSEIVNQATAVFTDAQTGQPFTMFSDRVTVSIQNTPPPPVKAVEFTKSASTLAPQRGQEVTFILSGVNHSQSMLKGMAIMVDGAPSWWVIARDIIPANTTFVRIDNAGGSRVLYHQINDPLHTYATTPPSDLSRVDAIAFDRLTVPVGGSLGGSFTVRIHANASGAIRNVAQLDYDDGVHATPVILDSNPIILAVTAKPPFIGFYRSTTFSVEAQGSHLGDYLNVQADAAQCNQDPTVAETQAITITSQLTGDQEIFTAVETGPNTGIFRIMTTIPTSSEIIVRGNGIIETLRNDALVARIEGCGGAAETTLLIDPTGVVFDSHSDAPVEGAQVTLIDVNTGAPALVYEMDGSTHAPSTVTTDSAGRYQFPLVNIGRYRLVVVPPPGYSVPSTIPALQLPAGRIIDPSGSYGGTFSVTRSGLVKIDVPADPTTTEGMGIFVQKLVSRTQAEIGDTLDYKVRIKNVSGMILKDVRLLDMLPAGFKYVPGSTRLENVKRPDPLGHGGAQLEFGIESMADGATVTVTYRARIGPGALEGDGINRAWVIGPRGLTSNVATVRVDVQAGVFTDKGVIIGKVFVDANRNRIQDLGELGIPGVRIYLEDGTFAITDSEGKYSFYGINPTTHVLKLDPTTMPRGSELLELSTRNAGDAGSLFVDLKKYELHKANFAEGSATPDIMRQVKERRAKGEVVVAEIDKRLKDRMIPDGTPIRVGDPKAMPATGMLDSGALPRTVSNGQATVLQNAGGVAPETNQQPNASAASIMSSANTAPLMTHGIAPWTNQPPVIGVSTNDPGTPANFKPILPADMLNSDNSDLPISASAPMPRISLEQCLTNSPVDNQLGFVDLQEGDTLPIAQTTVRVKGIAGGKFALVVNGEPVSRAHLGKTVVMASQKLEAWEFIGVNLKPGTNGLEVVYSDAFGNERGRRAIRVIAPDKLGRIRILLPKREQPADGVTPAKITVRLEDAHGVPVTARTPLTLEATLGRWSVEDLNKQEPGVQVFIEGGSATYEILPPQEPGDGRIRVSSGLLKSEDTLVFLPELRSMMAVGLIEGSINMSRLKSGSIIPARSKDGFDEALQEYSMSSGNASAGGRAAFFLKGKIKGEYLITAGFDSEKSGRERLFRDIQPDEYYPVYGDSSVRGYDAQSTGKLYVRVDNKRCYLLYGDFSTQTTSEARGLGNYNRSLTGVREHYEKNWGSFNLWASQDSTRQVIEELQANGTSGPFYFRTGDGILNSEQVEVLTRDRHQPSLILKTEPLSRFTDYEFEPFTGRLLLRRPLPSLDSNLNPISLRITYEMDQGGDKFFVYGGDGQIKLNSRVELGGSAVRDENPMGQLSLYSANSTVKVAEKTFLFGEVAQTQSELAGEGNAGRVELRHKGEKTDARVYYGQTEPTFTNNASILLPGRVEGGMKVTQTLNPKTKLIGQGLWTEDVALEGSRRGVRMDVERAIGNYRVELGARHSEETYNPASPTMVGATPNEVNSLRTKITAPVPKVNNATVYGEYENDIHEVNNRMIALGADYQMANKSRFYARHEIISSLGGPFEMNMYQQHNTTVAGLETDYMKDGQLFNEYRARDALSGREAESATGLRNLWNVADGVRVNTTMERVTPFTGANNQNEATAVTGAIEYTRNPLWKATARLELRTSTPNDSLLSTVSYARKVSRDWTFLSRAILMSVGSKSPGSGDKNQGRFQTGMAYRQTDKDIWSGLVKYELKYEEDADSPTLSLRRKVNVLSLDVNCQPLTDWTFNLHYAGKLAIEKSSDGYDTAHAHLVGGRVLYEFTRRWDAGINANTLFSGDFRSQQFGFGPEVGFTIRSNMRVGVGYNIFGFRDRDLDTGGNYNPGVFLNLRLKFDESLLGQGNNSKEK